MKIIKQLNITPTIIYNDCDLDKVKILNDSRNKAGIYCWINNINDKFYVGSSVNLTERFYKYYSLKHLTMRKTPIHNAILKYGYSNFSLAILEFVADKGEIINKEQYYLDLLDPDYNVLVIAGSALGYKHTEETLKVFKERVLSEEARNNLSIAATVRILTEEVREKISEKRKGIKLSEETRAKISKSASDLIGVKVDVFNIETNEKLSFDSFTSAAKYINVSRTAVTRVLKNGKLIQKIYMIKAK
uniref:GIY-YIG endonuclease n=1 Tax=Chrysoporthe cubensis TaxID=305400 RepID=A0A191MX63_9PEZI|nr:GIY-YIG endonuclease [Chrysoporthe cubensis]AMX22242.1 GIY-YIG endonuclease [Chrysoporthe cubensis]